MDELTADDRAANWALNFEPPEGWKQIAQWGSTRCLQNKSFKLIIDCEVKADGYAWMSLTISRKHGWPSYGQLMDIIEEFIGSGVYVYQVLPPREIAKKIEAQAVHVRARLDDVGGKVLEDSNVYA